MNQLYELTTENKKLLHEACDYYRENPNLAIKKLDEILATQKNLFVYSLKARVLGLFVDIPKKILDVIDEGLSLDATCYFLLAQKAQLLSVSFLKGDPEIANAALQAAMQCSDQALFHFTDGAKHNKTREELHEITYVNPSLEYLNEFNSEVSLKNVALQIGQLAGIYQALIGAQKASAAAQKASIDAAEALSNVAKERTRTIELLGLFTAIIAFIFSSIHFASNLQTIPEIMIAIIGMGAALLVFLLTLHMILDETAMRKPLIYLLIILGIVLLVLPLYAKWVGPQHASISKAPKPIAAELKAPDPITLELKASNPISIESKTIDKEPPTTDKASKPEPSAKK